MSNFHSKVITKINNSYLIIVCGCSFILTGRNKVKSRIYKLCIYTDVKTSINITSNFAH